MTTKFDPRITPALPDVAAKFLEGKVTARRFAHATPMQVVIDGAALYFSPSDRSQLESQLRLGEIFNVYKLQGEWCWGQNETDGYVGYVARAALTTDIEELTDCLVVPFSHIYPEPDLKTSIQGVIGLGAQVRSSRQENGFSEITGGRWIYSKHLALIGEFEPNYVATALSLMGVPYLWGGRTSMGLDCSSLIQLALARAGIDAPRDADLQENSLGQLIGDGRDLNLLQEGDLVFFPGHAGIVLEEFRFLHANAFDMTVSIHRLSDVLDRAKASGAYFTSIRRIYVTEAEPEIPVSDETEAKDMAPDASAPIAVSTKLTPSETAETVTAVKV